MTRKIVPDHEKFGENTDTINHVAYEAQRALIKAVYEYKLMPRVLRYLSACRINDIDAMVARYEEMTSCEQSAAHEARSAFKSLFG